MAKVKIYGIARRGHREKWFMKKEGKYRYKEIRRDAKGHFISTKKWSPKRPIGKPEYKEIYVEKEDVKAKVKEEFEKWEWEEFEVESPWQCPNCKTWNTGKYCTRCKDERP